MWSDKTPELDPETTAAKAALDAAYQVYVEKYAECNRIQNAVREKVDALYLRAQTRYNRLLGYDAAQAAYETACAVYEDADRAVKALQYKPGLRPISEQNNWGECIIAPDGTVYMVPMYEDHSNVFDRVAPRGRSADWVRVEAHGGTSDAYHNDKNLDTFTTEQVNALDAVAAAHDTLADEMQALGDSYGASNQRRYATRIREFLYPAPSEDEFSDSDD